MRRSPLTPITRADRHILSWLLATCVLIAGLLLYRLGSLVGGLSSTELKVAVTPIGWHGLYHQSLYLPLQILRSIDFFLFPGHGQTLTRLPNALLGGLAMLAFIALVRIWHSRRIALLTGALFVTSAWTLHVGRLASSDILYLAALPTLLLVHAARQRYSQHKSLVYVTIGAWGMLLYVPGLVWLVLIGIYAQRQMLADSWRHLQTWWQRLLLVLTGLVWLPLLVVNLLRAGNLKLWLGLPAHLPTPLHLLKQFAAVFVHAFVRGPDYPQVWLGQAPVLDVFVLAMALLGIYFYVLHFRATRSRLLGAFGLASVILIALGGPVGFSLLVPLLYLAAAAGIAYFLHEWLKIFPINPLARGVGIGLISVAVALSCIYGLRSYFVAWPHNPTTPTIFRYHR